MCYRLSLHDVLSLDLLIVLEHSWWQQQQREKNNKARFYLLTRRKMSHFPFNKIFSSLFSILKSKCQRHIESGHNMKCIVEWIYPILSDCVLILKGHGVFILCSLISNRKLIGMINGHAIIVSFHFISN